MKIIEFFKNKKVQFWLVVTFLVFVFAVMVYDISRTEYLTKMVMCDFPARCFGG